MIGIPVGIAEARGKPLWGGAPDLHGFIYSTEILKEAPFSRALFNHKDRSIPWASRMTNVSQGQLLSDELF